MEENDQLANPETSNALSPEAKKAKINLQSLEGYRAMAHGSGAISGAYVAYQKGSGFWGYVGYIILGSLLVGGTFRVATIPMENRFNRIIEENK